MATKRRRAIKYRNIAKIKDKQFNKLYRETMKQVKLVNERLNSLERRHESGTWASNKLKTRIKSNKTKGLMYKGKRIKLKPRMTKTNLTAVQKATRQFLESATSTNKGINKAKAETIKAIKDTLNLNKLGKKKLTESDVEKLYNMLNNKDLARFNDKSKGKEDEFIGASALWSEIDRATKENISKETFIERLQNLREQDFSIDDKKAAERIFERYIL